jgi:hypothetical protein
MLIDVIENEIASKCLALGVNLLRRDLRASPKLPLEISIDF